MKFTIQNKLLLPTTLIVAVVMICSGLYTSYRVEQQLSVTYEEELGIVSTILLKIVKSASSSTKGNLVAIATDNRLIDFVKGYSPDAPDRAEVLKKTNTTLETFNSLYSIFPILNIAMPDGLVRAGTNKAAIDKINVGHRAYFQAAMKGQTTISAPLMSMDINDKALVGATPIKDEKGTILAVLYAIIPCKTIIDQTIDGIKMGKSGFAFIFDKSGFMVAHPDYALVQEFDVKPTNWGKIALQEKTGLLHYTTPTGVDRIMSYHTDNDSGWTAVAAMDKAEITDVTSLLRNLSLAVTVVGILLVCLVLFLIVRPIVKALLAGVDFAQAVSKGDLDRPFNIRRNDELGTLAEALRVMVTNLKISINNAEQESQRAREESAKAVEATQTAETATANAETKSVNLLRAADRLEEVANIVSSASDELSSQIEQSEHGAATQAARVTETATAMEEMNSTVLEVAKNAGLASEVSAATRKKAEEGAVVVSKAVNGIRQVQQEALALKNDMVALDEHAKSISQIMGVISDIADQTNLLALNAAIEAARAGEAGRGFAVVADEVRKLAEKTMASTTDVSRAIKSIQDSASESMVQVDRAVKSIEEATEYANMSGTALSEIVTMVDNTADQVRAIATASEQQSASSEEINQSISEVNTIANETSQAMGEAARAVSDLAAQAQNLSHLIEDMKND